jgi:hypothetical protein
MTTSEFINRMKPKAKKNRDHPHQMLNTVERITPTRANTNATHVMVLRFAITALIKSNFISISEFLIF